jgi:short-subunit dehydrogenase
MKLKDKVAIVTGASEGIGEQIVLKLAKEEVNLALIARNKGNLKRVKEKALKLGAGRVEIYPCDICSTKELKVKVKKIVSDFKDINILINNAGIWQKISPVEKIKEEVVNDVIQINLTALIHATRLVLPYLKKQKEAAIINVISKSGVVAQEGQSVYTASKYGAHGFTEVLKADLKGSNVRVAGVYQSGTATKMFAKTGEKAPVEKFTDPADLAEVIVFMLSRPPKIWLHEVNVEY